MKLSKVLAFIDSVKHKRFKDGCTVMPISVTNKDNLAIWDSEKGVSRAIAYMIEIGLISVENDRYQFGAYYEKDNRSKSYYYYKENEDKIKAYCISNNIEIFVVKNKIYDIKEIESLHTEIDCNKVRFAKSLKLVKPTNLSKSDFEKQLTLCLYKNYPALAFHIEKANEINENYYAKYPEFRIRFRPNFTWSDDGTYVNSIGIRATNSMTNLKKEKRAEVLKAYGFTLEKVRQGVFTLSEPMKQLEADLKNHIVIYDNNPVLKWCLANTQAKVDVNGNIQPCKLNSKYKRIDGAVALIIAYSVLNSYKKDYETMQS